MPGGGAAGVTSPRTPSHHGDHGTSARQTTTSTTSRTEIITQFASSSARDTLRAMAVIRKTTSSSRTHSISSSSCSRPVISANSP